MALTVESASTGARPNRATSVGHGIGLAVAALVAAAAIGAAVLGWPGGVRSQLGWLMLALGILPQPLMQLCFDSIKGL